MSEDTKAILEKRQALVDKLTKDLAAKNPLKTKTGVRSGSRICLQKKF